MTPPTDMTTAGDMSSIRRDLEWLDCQTNAARESFLSPTPGEDTTELFLEWIAREFEMSSRNLKTMKILEDPGPDCGHEWRAVGLVTCQCPPRLDVKQRRRCGYGLFRAQYARTKEAQGVLLAAREKNVEIGVEREKVGLRLEKALRRAGRAEEDGARRVQVAQGQVRRFRKKLERKTKEMRMFAKGYTDEKARRKLEAGGRAERAERRWVRVMRQHEKSHSKLRQERAAHRVVSGCLAEKTAECDLLTEDQTAAGAQMWEMERRLEAEMYEHGVAKTLLNDERVKSNARKAQLQDAQAKSRRHEADFRRLQGHVETMTEQLSTSQARQAQLQAKLDSTNNAKPALETDLRKTCSALGATESAKQDAEARLTSLEADNNDLNTTLEEEREGSKGMATELQAALEKVEDLETKVQNSTSQASEIGEELRQKDATLLLEATQQMGRDLTMADRREADAVSRVVTSNLVTIGTLSDVSRQEGRDVGSVGTGLLANYNRACRNFSEEREKNLALQDDLRKVRQDLSHSVAELTSERDTLSRTLEDHRRTSAEQLAAVKSELVSSKQAFVGEERAHQLAEDALTECKANAKGLEEDFAKEKRQAEHFRCEGQKALRGIRKHESKIKRLGDALAKKGKEIAEAEAESRRMVEEGTRSQDELATTKGRLCDLRAKNFYLTDQADAAEEEAASLREIVQVRNTEQYRREEEVDRLHNQVRELRSELASLKAAYVSDSQPPGTPAFHITAQNANFFYPNTQAAKPSACPQTGNAPFQETRAAGKETLHPEDKPSTAAPAPSACVPLASPAAPDSGDGGEMDISVPAMPGSYVPKCRSTPTLYEYKPLPPSDSRQQP